MIKITIKKNAENKVLRLKISGHAESNEFGKDLVCAAVTGIVSGALNALDLKFSKEVNLNVKENEIVIINLSLSNNDLQIMLEMLIVQLKTIWTQYKKNIKLQEVY